MAATVNLAHCGRCHKPHDELQLKRFVYAPIVGGTTLTHWTLCPETGEPILMDYGMTVSSGTVPADSVPEPEPETATQT